jgi:hypothetical protein
MRAKTKQRHGSAIARPAPRDGARRGADEASRAQREVKVDAVVGIVEVARGEHLDALEAVAERIDVDVQSVGSRRPTPGMR